MKNNNIRKRTRIRGKINKKIGAVGSESESEKRDLANIS